MENRCGSPSQSRHSRRGRERALVALLAAGALLVGCTTTHKLGRIDDPGVRAQIDALAADGDAIVHVRHPPRPGPPPFGETVKAVTPQGLVIEPTRGQPLLVPREQVTSLSRYDHGRGAGDGALALGIPGFLVGLTFGFLAASVAPGCSDDCGPGPNPVTVGFGAGAVLGVIGAALGTLFGAAGGHEDRFEITP